MMLKPFLLLFATLCAAGMAAPTAHAASALQVTAGADQTSVPASIQQMKKYPLFAGKKSITKHVPADWNKHYTHLPTPAFQDASRFVLHGVAADYVSKDYPAFREAADIKALYRDGIIDAASYIVRENRFENIVGGSVLVFDQRHTQPVVGDIAVGTPMASVLQQFGDPDFDWKAHNLIGYKTEQFYIGFTGQDKVDHIYLSKRYPQGSSDDVLPALLTSESPNDFPFAAWNLEGRQLWRGSMTYNSRGGLEIQRYESQTVYIHKDYRGQVPKSMPKKGPVFFTDVDYPEYKIYAAVYEETYVQKTLAAEGHTSPDKRMEAIEFGLCTYERAGLLFRRLDGGGPDTFITPGHFPSPPFWLSSRYVGIETMDGFGVYDLEAYPDNYEASEFSGAGKGVVFYVKYHDAGGPFIQPADGEVSSLVIPSEGFTIQPRGGAAKRTLDSSEKQQLQLTFHYDAAGKLGVKYALVPRKSR